MAEFFIGDVVTSTAGRDKGEIFLVTDVTFDRVFVVNGKTRKTGAPKKKNPKHLVKAAEASLKEEALKIKRKEPYGAKKLYKAIKRASQNQ